MRRFLAARAAGLVAAAAVVYGLLVGVIALAGWLGPDIMAAVVGGGFAYGVAVAALALVADRGADRLVGAVECARCADADGGADDLAVQLARFDAGRTDRDGSRGLNADRLALDFAAAVADRDADRDGDDDRARRDRDRNAAACAADFGRTGRLDAERHRDGADRAGAPVGGPARAGAAPVTWVAP